MRNELHRDAALSAITFGEDLERGGDLVCFWRGIPVYLNANAIDQALFKRVPSEGKPNRILVGVIEGRVLRDKATRGAAGFTLPLVPA